MELKPDQERPGTCGSSSSVAGRWRWLLLAAASVAAMMIGVGVGVGVGLSMRQQQAAGGSGGALGADGLSGAKRALLFKARRTRPSVVLIGDGLTESGFSFRLGGWGSQLTGAYLRKADVINRGFGGYYTTWFKDYMLDSLFDVANPEMGVLFLGVKDSQVKAAAGKAYVSPEQYRANLEAVMQKGKEAGVKYWLIITPPPVYEPPGKTGGARTSANTKLYVDQLKALAKDHNAAFLDIFESWARIPGWADKYLNPDKLHLNPEGNSKLFSDVLNTIKAQIPDMDPANMAWQFPAMGDIDRENPGPAFAGLTQ